MRSPHSSMISPRSHRRMSRSSVEASRSSTRSPRSLASERRSSRRSPHSGATSPHSSSIGRRNAKPRPKKVPPMTIFWRRMTRSSQRMTRCERQTAKTSFFPVPDPYLPVRSRWLHPGQQQGRRSPSSSSSWVRRMRRARVVFCLASPTQQMNSLRARGVMSFQAASAAWLATSALRRSSGSSCTTPPGSRWPLTGSRRHGAHVRPSGSARHLQPYPFPLFAADG
jgi:hypothetical protein